MVLSPARYTVGVALFAASTRAAAAGLPFVVPAATAATKNICGSSIFILCSKCLPSTTGNLPFRLATGRRS